MKDGVPSAPDSTRIVPAGQQSGRPTQRKTQPPRRRVSARVADRRVARPIIFNYGANLTRHEREKAKERLAMIAAGGVAAICVLILAWGLIYQNVIEPAQPVATVNGTDIHKTEYGHMEKWQALQLNARTSQAQQQMARVAADKKLSALTQYLQQQYQQLQAQQQTIPADTLTSMEETIVMHQSAASEFGIKATAAALDKELTTVRKQIGGTVAYGQVLNSTGLSGDEFRRWVIEPAYLRTQVTNRLGATVSPYGAAEVHARHILVKTKALAQQILAQLRAGGSWKALARKYSTDTGSKAQGGDLGTFTQGTMVAPFDKAVFSMKPGEIRLVKSTFGWHIVQDLSKPARHKLTAQELQSKKDTAFTTWIQARVGSARISPASAVPTFGYSGLGSPGGTTSSSGAPVPVSGSH